MVVGLLFSTDDGRTRILVSDATCGSAFCATGDNLHDHLTTLNHDDDHTNVWDFADLPVDSHPDVPANSRQNFDAIRKFCCSANPAVLENANALFSPALQYLNADSEHDSSMAVGMVAFGCAPY